MKHQELRNPKDTKRETSRNTPKDPKRNIKPRHRRLGSIATASWSLHCHCMGLIPLFFFFGSSWFGFSILNGFLFGFLSSLVWVSSWVSVRVSVWVMECNGKAWMRNWVCKAWFQFKWNRALQTRFICHDPETEFSKLDYTRDVSFLNCFENVLTNKIVWKLMLFWKKILVTYTNVHNSDLWVFTLQSSDTDFEEEILNYEYDQQKAKMWDSERFSYKCINVIQNQNLTSGIEETSGSPLTCIVDFSSLFLSLSHFSIASFLLFSEKHPCTFYFQLLSYGEILTLSRTTRSPCWPYSPNQ